MPVLRPEARERVAWVVAGARSGAGRALLVTGQAGSGKSTLLEQALERAGDAVVLRAAGVPVESGLPHSGLHAVLRPLAPLVAELPDVQRDALRVVLGLAAGPAPSPFLLGAAVLGLLAAQAERAACLVVVDDAQWLDEASLAALAFAARRLAGERVGVLVAARDGRLPRELAGLPRCELGPLTAAEVAELLGCDPAEARARLTASGGNLLALVESAAGPVFADRVAALPVEALDAAVLWALAGDVPAAVPAAALRSGGLPADALVPAEAAGLLTASAEGVRWRHALAREAVLAAAGPARVRQLADVLAVAAEHAGAPRAAVVELRLAAAGGPDEALALALEDLAAEADRTGDHDRAAHCWQRAAGVGTDGRRRPVRLHEAAEASLRAGRLRLARGRYGEALAAGLDGADRARAHLALGRVEHTAGSPRRALVELAAAAEAAGTPALRVRAGAEGVLAAMYAADPAAATALADRVRAEHDPARPDEVLLALHAQGAAAALRGDPGAAAPLLAAAVEVAERHDVLTGQPDLVLWVLTAGLFPGGPAGELPAVVGPALDALRLRGDLVWLPRVVRLWGLRQELAGHWLRAHAAYEEAVELSRAAEQTTQLVEALHALAQLEAVRGEREACLLHAAEAEALLAGLDVPFLSAHAWYARGLLHLGLGEPAAAAAALAPATALPEGVHWRAEAVGDLVQALVLDGRHEQAAQAAATAPSDRAAGLLEADDAEAVRLLLAAADGDPDPLTAARTRLLAGSRLRRAGRRREAREQLRAAADVLERAGAQPWQRQAQEELRASGESLARGGEPREALTGAELRVAALVAEGRPTREVAALLYLSPKTVEFHLSRIYRKLEVRGRAELAHRLTTA